MKLKTEIKNLYIFLLVIFSFSIPPVYAYGGPGAAIGAIIILITVILAFFSSLIIKIFNLIKISFLKLNAYINSIKTKKSKKIKKR